MSRLCILPAPKCKKSHSEAPFCRHCAYYHCQGVEDVNLKALFWRDCAITTAKVPKMTNGTSRVRIFRHSHADNFHFRAKRKPRMFHFRHSLAGNLNFCTRTMSPIRHSRHSPASNPHFRTKNTPLPLRVSTTVSVQVLTVFSPPKKEHVMKDSSCNF